KHLTRKTDLILPKPKKLAAPFDDSWSARMDRENGAVFFLLEIQFCQFKGPIQKSLNGGGHFEGDFARERHFHSPIRTDPGHVPQGFWTNLFAKCQDLHRGTRGGGLSRTHRVTDKTICEQALDHDLFGRVQGRV